MVVDSVVAAETVADWAEDWEAGWEEEDWEEEATDWEEEATAAVDSVAEAEAKAAKVAARARRRVAEEVTGWAEVEKVVDSVGVDSAVKAKAAATVEVESSDRRSPARCRMWSTTCRPATR